MEGNTILEKKQVFVYPLTSLVAEFGGALGLFVGFSFLLIWDLVYEIISTIFSTAQDRFNKQ